jgi:hypothetical protein
MISAVINLVLQRYTIVTNTQIPAALPLDTIVIFYYDTTFGAIDKLAACSR